MRANNIKQKKKKRKKKKLNGFDLACCEYIL